MANADLQSVKLTTCFNSSFLQPSFGFESSRHCQHAKASTFMMRLYAWEFLDIFVTRTCPVAFKLVCKDSTWLSLLEFILSNLLAVEAFSSTSSAFAPNTLWKESPLH